MAAWTAKWIWIDGTRGGGRGTREDELPRNFYLCARKAFDAPRDLQSATLRITADARYVLFVNGQRIGNGPIRGWQHSWFYDTYDLTPHLRPGERNAIGVLVIQPGETNFQYPLGRGGLLAQLDMTTKRGRKVTVATDRTWRVLPHPAYDRRTPRISCQQGFVEHYDATRDEGRGTGDWATAEFDDSKWQRAVELGKVGIAPWKKLVPRNIPFLTMEPIYPTRIMRIRTVEPPEIVHSIDLRPNLIPGDRLSNPHGLTGLALTIVRAKKATEVRVRAVGGIGFGARRARVNGEDATFDEQGAILKLRKGDNLVVFDVTRDWYHDWWFTTVWDAGRGTRDELEFVNPLGKAETVWATAGPFNSRDDEGFQAVWNAKSVADLEKAKQIARLQPVALEHTASDHVFARIVLAKGTGDEGRGTRAENLDAICQPNDEIATIYPPRQGDVELLIDFGRELVGFWEFELDAPKGTVLDFYGFEAVHPTDDGGFEIQHTWGLNNVMRYIARDGWQRYTSIVRRGFRYLVLTVRFPKGEKRPVRIKTLRCLLNTYPYTERGEFVCDDWKLNEIWRMCRYTLRLCSEDTFVDCPAYEQTFWVGDARNEALIAYATYGGYELARRCWLLAGQSLWRSPLVESQVPSGWQDILTAWALLWVWACEEYYRYTGDEEFLREIYPFVAQQMRNIAEQFIRPDGLFEIEAWNMLDWAPMDTPRKGVVTHQNAMLVEAYRRAAAMALLLGKSEDAKEFEALAQKVEDAINEHLWDEQRQAFIDAIHTEGTRDMGHGTRIERRSNVFSVQTQTMVYLCDAVTDERRPIIRRYLYDKPEGFVWFGSPFALFFLLEAYAKDGEFQRILDIIRREWGAMIDYGATTAWETLTPRTRSHCHAWSAAPAYFLSTYVLGVRPKGGTRDAGRGTGVREYFIAPKPCDLKWARGKFPVPIGTRDGGRGARSSKSWEGEASAEPREIEVRWERDERKFTLWFALPSSARAEIVLPPIVPEGASVNTKLVKGEATSPKFEANHWRIKVTEGSQGKVEASW
jgi:alpha-L-rhamnosidase